jgi:hypothetical protein
MTAGMFHVTNLTPPGNDNPSRAYGQHIQLMTASMIHVINLTPGSDNSTSSRSPNTPVLMRWSSGLSALNEGEWFTSN